MSTFLEEYNSLKKFRSSLRISFGSLILVPLWLIKDDKCFRRHFNFSKLRKYLLFFSPCSYQRALLLKIAPRGFSVWKSESLILIRSSSALSSSLCAVWSLALSWANRDVGSYSSSRLRFTFNLENLTVKPLISILTISQNRPLSSTSLYFATNSGILERNKATYSLSVNKELLNLQ